MTEIYFEDGRFFTGHVNRHGAVVDRRACEIRKEGDSIVVRPAHGVNCEAIRERFAPAGETIVKDGVIFSQSVTFPFKGEAVTISFVVPVGVTPEKEAEQMAGRVAAYARHQAEMAEEHFKAEQFPSAVRKRMEAATPQEKRWFRRYAQSGKARDQVEEVIAKVPGYRHFFNHYNYATAWRVIAAVAKDVFPPQTRY